MTEREGYALQVGEWTTQFALACWLGLTGRYAHKDLELLLRTRVGNALQGRRLLRELEAAADTVAESLLSGVPESADPDWRRVVGALPHFDERLGILLDPPKLQSGSASWEYRSAQCLYDTVRTQNAIRPNTSESVIVWTACAAATALIGELRSTSELLERLTRQGSISDVIARIATEAIEGTTRPDPPALSVYDIQDSYLSSLCQLVWWTDTGSVIASTPHLAARKQLYVERRVSDPAAGSAPTRLSETVARHPAVLLCGEAGAGKSVALAYLAAHFADRALNTDRGRDPYPLVPVLVRLRHCTEAVTSFAKLAEFAVQSTVKPAVESWLGERIEHGPTLLLLDGLDEMPQRERHKTWDWLSRAVTNRTDHRLIISTRPAATEGYKAGLFRRLNLEPLDDDEISDLIGLRSHYEKRVEPHAADAAKVLLASLDRSPELRQLAGNPLMCTMLWSLSKVQDLSSTKSGPRLYQHLLDRLLDTQPSALPQKRDSLSSGQLMLVLERLAYWFLSEGYNEAELEAVLTTVDRELAPIKRYNKGPSAIEVLRDLIERVCILRESAPGRVEFIHVVFQEYLASRVLSDEVSLDLLAELAQSGRWCHPIALAAQNMSKDRFYILLDSLWRRANNSSVHRGELIQTINECALRRPEIGTLPTLAPDPPSERSAERHLAIIALDIEAYAQHTTTQQHSIRGALLDVARSAIEASGPSWSECLMVDNGDGAVIIAPDTLDFSRFITAVCSALEDTNRGRSAENQQRVRMALNQGRLTQAPLGFVGEPLATTLRLLDSVDLRHDLRYSDAVLAVIVPDSQKSAIDGVPSPFRMVSVTGKDIKTRAWVGVLGSEQLTSSPRDSVVAVEYRVGLSGGLVELPETLDSSLWELASHSNAPRDGMAALRAPGVGVIAPLLRRTDLPGSPSLQVQSEMLTKAGARILCVGDEGLEILPQIKAAIPTLFDGTLHNFGDVSRARVRGADMVAVTARFKNLGACIERIEELDMTTVVRVSTVAEIDRAIEAGARALLIASTPRDEETSGECFARLVGDVPSGIVTIADRLDRHTYSLAGYADAGAGAVLIGAGYLEHRDPTDVVRKLVRTEGRQWAQK